MKALANYMYKIILSFIVATLFSCNTTTPVKQEIKKIQTDKYIYEVDSDQHVKFSGYADYEEFQNRKASQGMYVGYDAITFFASIVAHGVISSTSDKMNKSKYEKNINNHALSGIDQSIHDYALSNLRKRYFKQYTASKPMNEQRVVLELSENELAKGTIKSIPLFLTFIPK